jgi:predicted exporter
MKRWAWLCWLVLVVACAVQVQRSVVVTDVSSFLPGPANAAQRLLVDQLRDGLSTRILLVGLQLEAPATGAGPSALQTQSLVAASRALRDKLAADPAVAWVSNGDLDALEAERERLFAARYLLSPAIDERHFSQVGLARAFVRLQQMLASARGAAIRPIATADPTLSALQLLEKASRQLAPQADAGVWLGSDGRVAILLLETRARGHDIERLRAGIQSVRRHADAVLQQWPAGETRPVTGFGGAAYFNVLSHDAIGQDAEQLAVLAAALVAVLLWWVLRSPRFLALAVVPVATGALAGFAMVGVTADAIHGITLAFGVTLIGEAVDYAIYTFVQSDERGDQSAHFWRQVYLAAATSLIGFGAMYFSGFAGLRQLGLFSITGLLVAVACTRWLLPDLLPRGQHTGQADRFGWLPVVCQRMRALRWPVLLVALVCLALLVQRHESLWQDNLDSLSASSPQDNQRDARLRQDVGVPDLRTMIAVQGADLEQALQRAEASTRVLDTLVAAKVLAGYDSPTDLLPSRALQMSRQAALPPEQELRARVVQAASAGTLRAQAFEPFIADVTAARAMPPVDLAYYSGTILAQWLQAQIVRSADGVTVLVLLRGAPSTVDLRARLDQAQLPGVTMVDLKGDVELLVAQYRQRAMVAALLGTVAICVALAWQRRQARAVLSMAATIAATITLTSGLLWLVAGQLTVFHLVSLLLVVGVASNYTLFFSTLSPQPRERQRASLSVLLAAASTFIAFATLAFSSTPVLAMIGLTVSIGAAVGLFTSMVFSADSRAG